MPRTAINVYSLRDLDEDVETVVNRVANAGYDGIQFSGHHSPTSSNLEAVTAAIEDTGLDVAPPHVGIEDLEDRLTEIVDIYETVGVDAAVVPGLSPEDFESRATVDAVAQRINELADDLAEVGWDLHYHNHSFEYVDLDGELAFERFIDATEVGIELDVGWALVGGEDPARRIRQLGDRAKLLHMKDMDTSVEHGFVDIGEGDVDMRSCAEAAEAVGTEWLIYEHDDPDDPAATTEIGADFLNRLARS